MDARDEENPLPNVILFGSIAKVNARLEYVNAHRTESVHLVCQIRAFSLSKNMGMNFKQERVCLVIPKKTKKV